MKSRRPGRRLFGTILGLLLPLGAAASVASAGDGEVASRVNPRWQPRVAGAPVPATLGLKVGDMPDRQNP